MNINLKALTFIILIISPLTSTGNYSPLNVQSQESINYEKMKTQLKSGSSCLTGDLYNNVRLSTSSMKYYCEFVCSKYKRYKQSNYIEANYGKKGEKLGEGSFGIVYKYHGKNGKKYAIKIPKSFKYKELFEELNSSECIKEKVSSFYKDKMGFIRECVTPSGKNPHLIMYFYSQSLEEKMKSTYNNDISTYSIEKKKLLYTDMVYLAAELRELHRIGLAHRDLKPENAMISDANIPILVDFGMTTPNLLQAKTVCGTPLFMDPDLITRKTNGGATSDIYALGIIYYIMMTGDAGWDTVNSMLMNGGYGTIYFNPDFNVLGLTGEKAFIKNLLVSSVPAYGKPARWDIEKVYQYIKSTFQKLDEPPVKEDEAPQVTQRYAQQTRRETKTYRVQADQTNQVIQNAKNVMYNQTPVREYATPQKVVTNNEKVLPYYRPVQNLGGENLNQFGNYLNRNQVHERVHKIVYHQPRIIIRHPPQRVIYNKLY